MKNCMRNFGDHTRFGALLILVFGPSFGFGIFAGPPNYSHETGSAENQEETDSADKTGTPNQLSAQSKSSQGIVDPGTNKNIAANQKTADPGRK